MKDSRAKSQSVQLLCEKPGLNTSWKHYRQGEGTCSLLWAIVLGVQKKMWSSHLLRSSPGSTELQCVVPGDKYSRLNLSDWTSSICIFFCIFEEGSQGAESGRLTHRIWSQLSSKYIETANPKHGAGGYLWFALGYRTPVLSVMDTESEENPCSTCRLMVAHKTSTGPTEALSWCKAATATANRGQKPAATSTSQGCHL